MADTHDLPHSMATDAELTVAVAADTNGNPR
jgi:hypothetical protein